jgi:hypothetical protein
MDVSRCWTQTTPIMNARLLSPVRSHPKSAGLHRQLHRSGSHALLLRELGRALAREWLLTAGLPVIWALPQEEDRAASKSSVYRADR